MKNTGISLLVSILLTVCFAVSPSPAQEASLEGITVTNTRDHLLVYFKVANCFTEDLTKAIHNGIGTTFTFLVEVYEKRELWWDKKVADLSVAHEIQYDSLKKTYRVSLSEKGGEVLDVTDFEKAKALMSEIVGLEVVPLKELQKGKRYRVSLKAELDKIRLPFYLHHILFFLSLWDFETDWYTVDFTY